MRHYYKKALGVSLGSRLRFLTLSLFAALLACGTAFAQTGSIKGVVRDAEGAGLIGANVVVKGTMNGTVVDNVAGEFALSNIDARNAVLTISYIGYATQEVVLNGRTFVEIMMLEDNNNLDEVVVIGYGSLSKKELSSSVVQVSRNDFLKGAVNSPMEMLSGKVAGLNVNSTSAANPNSDPSLQIRGATSLSASNSPLIIIDGIAGGNLRVLSSQDIESMTVLKDAASAAIYGTRGANGVILVTTKKGGGSSTQVTYDSWFASNFAKKGPQVLSADEFRRSRRGTDYGYSTDWYDLLLRDFSYDVNQYLSVTGGNNNGSYSASLNYKKATGLDIITAREEFGGRFAVDQRMLKNRLQFSASLNARRVNEDWDAGQFDNALSMNPTLPVYNEDGTYYQPSSPTGARNPISEMKLNDSNGQRMYVLGAAELKLNILQNANHSLSTSLSYSLDYNDLKQAYYTPSTAGESYWNGYAGRAEVTYQKWWTNRIEWLFNYSMDLGDHSLKAVAGYTYEDNNWERLRASNNDFSFDSTKWHDLGSGSYLTDGLASMATGKSLSKLIGVFGRVNYNWRDLLMGSVALRYEGSTKFGANNKWGAFPSASLAWELANMEFMEGARDVVKSLKPRVSYGVTGRSDFDSYRSLATYGTSGSYFMDGEWVVGYRPSINANPDLAWEKSISTNVGVDFVLWDKLRGSIDLFDRQSQDLLYNYTAPQPPFVYPNILVNVGTTQNRGVEVALNYDVFKKSAVKWTTGVNYSYGKTKLKKLSNSIYQLSALDLYLKPGVGTSEYFFHVTEGGDIGQFYGYEYAGVENGNMLIYDDQNNKIPVGEAKATYKRYIGNGTPQHFLSWSNTIRYKGFDLDVFFRGAFGFDIFNMRKYGMGLKGSGSDNVLRSAYGEDNYISTGGGVISSFFLENGNYFKLDNVTLGYNFALKSRTVDNLRLYLTARNIYTFTGYSGNDPSVVSVNGITPGVDVSGAYPSALQLSVGVTLRFK